MTDRKGETQIGEPTLLMYGVGFRCRVANIASSKNQRVR